MARPLYGIHDAGGEHLLPKGSAIVITEAIGHDPNDLSGRDYRQWSDRGYLVLVRLNNGYGAEGTLPLGEYYGDFARRCANFVRNSAGCTHWIIGNEPNHAQEWPQGQPISAHEYAGCFRMVAERIFERCGEQHLTITAAVAPWNVQVGDWLLYQRTMLRDLLDIADGIAIHTYTHGTDPALVTSDAKMDAPGFTDRYFHFRAYRDLLNAIPNELRDLPVWITETDQDEAWADVNSGWVVAAYGEIEHWNRQPGNQQLHGMALYRWLNHDKWGISEKRGVQEDLVAAVTKGYRIEAEGSDQSTSPQPSPEGEVERQDIAMKWDPRLTERGVSVSKAQVPVGTPVYRLVRAEYMTPEESGGNANIFVDVLDENGVRMVGAPVVQSWQDGDATQRIEEKRGERAGTSFLMTSPGNPYHIHVGGGATSDVVQGMGLGTIAEPWIKHHVGYYLVFQRVVEGSTVEPAPGGEIPQVPTPITPPVIVQQPMVTGILEPAVMEAIIAIESGGQGIVNGKPIIRFEPAVFERYIDADTFKRHFRYGSPAWTKREMNDGSGWTSLEDEGQVDQWRAYDLARRLNPEGAASSISVGLGQIMGFHYKSLGYPTVDAMLEDFKSVPMQLVGMVNFILGRPELAKAVNAHDWRTIARIYNGAGNVDYYAGLLESKYKALKAGG